MPRPGQLTVFQARVEIQIPVQFVRCVMTLPQKCKACRDGKSFETPITMAFQPIVDVEAKKVFAHEALVRGVNGESAGQILDSVTDETRYGFD